MIQMNLLTKQKQTHRPGRGMVREVGTETVHTAILKWITNKDLL